MSEDTILRAKVHEAVDASLNSMFAKFVPADEGIVDIDIRLTTTSEDLSTMTITDWCTELISIDDVEAWEVEEQVIHVQEFSNPDNALVTNRYTPF